LGRKNFSHGGSNFPSGDWLVGPGPDQRMGKLEAEQMVAIHVGYADGAGAQDTRSLGKGISGNQGRAGNLEQNLRRERQGAADGNQRSAGGDVQGCGEFQQLLAILVAAADKDRNRQGQAGPLTVLDFGASSLQPYPSNVDLTHSLPHLGGQTDSRMWTPRRTEPPEGRASFENGPIKAGVSCGGFCPIFAVLLTLSEVSEHFGLQAFSLP